MIRRFLTLAGLGAAFVFLAVPAQAKGPLVRESVTVTVGRPGAGAPVRLHWSGRCPLGFPCPQSLSDYAVLLSDSGVFAPTWDGSAPVPDVSRLGPKYGITFRFVINGHHTYIVRQTLYPLGPGPSQYLPQLPWLFMAPGQRVGDVELASGWRVTAPTVVNVLRAHGLGIPVGGLTATPSSGAVASPVQAAGATAARPPRSSTPIVILAGIAVLIALVVITAVAGRRASATAARRGAPG